MIVIFIIFRVIMLLYVLTDSSSRYCASLWYRMISRGVVESSETYQTLVLSVMTFAIILATG